MTLYLDTGQLILVLIVAGVIFATGALVEWLADNWRHRH